MSDNRGDTSRGFDWFRNAVDDEQHPSWPPRDFSFVSPDPDVQRALEAREEYARSTQALMGRFSSQQLASMGLPSPASSTPYGMSPQLQSLNPTAPPSTVPSQQGTPNTSQRWVPTSETTPNLSTRTTPLGTPLSHSSRRRESGGTTSGRQRARRSSRGGGGCCFGGGGTDSGPETDDVIYSRTPNYESEDHDAPLPNDGGLYYVVKRDGGVDMGNSQGITFRTHLRSLIHSTLQNCFLEWEQQDSNDVDYIQGALQARFPNPRGRCFTREWLEGEIKNFLRNKRSTVRRAAREQRANPRQNKRGANMHDAEWQFALDEIDSGVDSRQQREARARQRPTHWGSGSKAAWKDKYVSFNIFL